MSKDENKSELHPKNGEMTFIMPNTNALGALKNAEKGRKLSISYKTKEQWLAQIGEPVKCYFLGLKEAENAKGDPYFLAKLHDGENGFVCAQTVLVQALMSTEVGQGVEITCTGSNKGSSGNDIPLFEVIELDINITRGDE